MKVVVWGKNRKFIHFLEKLSEVYVSNTLIEAISVAKDGADALFILPDYDASKNFIEEFSDEEISSIIEVISNGKTKIYIENYPSYDARDYYIFGLQARSYVDTLTRNSIRLLGDFKDEMGFELLQKRNGIFYQNEKHYEQEIDLLMEIRNCLGVHDVLAEDENNLGIALARTKQNVYTAMVDFTNFHSNFSLPYGHWKKFYGKIFGEILNIESTSVEEAFVDTYRGIQTEAFSSYKRTDKEKKEALEKSVLNAVKWHLESGLMPSPDGSLGVYEMVRSFDLNFAKNIRGDASLFTAALFKMAGRYFDNEQWEKISENILHETLVNRKIQIKEGPNKGLFKWFSGIGEYGTHIIYASDSARGGNCLYALYKNSGDESLKEDLILLGEAFLKWFSGDGLICGGGCFNYDNCDLDKIQSFDKCKAPEFYEAIMILLKNIYTLTGDVRYKRQILKTAEEIAKIHPDYGIGASHSKNFTLSRALTVFAVAQSFGSGIWTKKIDEILNYFKELQHFSGGFSDGKAYFDETSLKKDMEFAIGFGPEHGNICDLMYCQNTMLYTLNILRKCNTDEIDKDLVEKMFESATDFLLNVQIVSDDKRLSGGWMRAYDMDLDEYYGCDKDFAWGAYSILAGWVTGAIPIVFLDLLGVETMY